jgi:hypothetical protein
MKIEINECERKKERNYVLLAAANAKYLINVARLV